MTEELRRGPAVRARRQAVSIAIGVTCLLAVLGGRADTESRTPRALRSPTKVDEQIASVVTQYLQRNHYTRVDIDDDISSLVFDEYFSQLDPTRTYFLQSDLDEFAPYRLSLDDMLKEGDLTFGFKVYERYLLRIQERLKALDAILAEDFDFEQDEEMLLDRKEAPWARSRQELDDIWRQRIKNQLLIAEILDEEEAEKADAEAATEGAGAVDKVAAEPVEETDQAGDDPAKDDDDEDELTWDDNLTPRERIRRRHENYLKFRADSDNADVLEYYLSTLAQVLDPHSSYLNWRSLEDFNIAMRLSLQGIGATLTSKDGYTEVVSIIPGGPADEQGELKPGHRIIAVAQGKKQPEDVVNMPLNKVVRRIRGSKGTEVRLTVIRSLTSMPQVIKIVRDEVKLTEQEAKGEVRDVTMPDGRSIKIGVLDIPSFYADFDGIRRGDPNAKSTTRDAKRIIDEMIEHDQIAGLVIDLRSNGGGSLDEAISLTGLFIPEGPVVQVRQRAGTEQREDTDQGFAYDLPLVAMVNQLSASASEIFSGAVQDYGRGVIVGNEHTHGKGTVQTVLQLERGSRVLRNKNPGALKYTMAKFYRITGHSTQKKGITPDLIFPSFLDHMDLGEGTLDFVLQWDEIEPRDFRPSALQMSNYLNELRQRSLHRLAGNEEYQQLLVDIEKFAERKQQKTLSLKKSQRIAMRQEDEYWNKRSQAVLGKNKRETDEDDKDQDEDEDITDIYLIETLSVTADLVSMLERDNKLAAKLITHEPAEMIP